MELCPFSTFISVTPARIRARCSLRTTFPVATLDDLDASLTEAGLANTMLMVVMEGTGDDGESEYSYDDDDDDDSDAGGS